MIEPKEYQVKEHITEQQFIDAGFTSKPEYFVIRHSLYKNLINLILLIDKEDYYHVAKVNDSDGEIYYPFYNPDFRNNNLVAKEVIENYNKFMDKLVKKGIITYKNKYDVRTKVTETRTIKIKYFTDIDKIEEFSNGDWIDLRAAEEVTMKAGDFKLISLGIAMQLPDGYEAHVAPRSSTYKNFGIIQTNSLGIIDNSYCGDNDMWKFPAYAMRDTIIHKNDRICQFRIVKNQPPIIFEEVKTLGNKDRGGWGSTGNQ